MRRIRTGLFLLFMLTTAQAMSTHIHAQQALTYKSFRELLKEIEADQESVTVLNFWATWCKPCVEELPDFEKLHTEYAGKKVKVILANLDFHSKTETAVVPFMEKNHITARVVHITDEDANEWINLAEPKWSGAIPATLIYDHGKKVWFFEGKLNFDILKTEIIKYIQS